MTGEIISVGTELLLGQIVNTDAAYAARGLADLGISVYYQVVVGDNRERLSTALEAAFSRSDLVILTGGLGPTGDDLTKEVTAEYFGLPLAEDPAIAGAIAARLARAGILCTAESAKQAMVPQGARVFPNQNGTAPGLAIRQNGRTAILLPGPPREMEPMFRSQIVPYLRSELDGTIRSHSIRLFGIGEAQLEQDLPAALFAASNPTLAPYAKNGEVELRVTARGQSPEQCEEAMRPVIGTIYEILGAYVYGVDVPNLQTVLVHELEERSMTIATAESLTGGLVSERITQVPGASAVFALGVCTYSDSMKAKVLGVAPTTLDAFGAVSRQTAGEMAHHVRELAGADIGVSTTGFAGPAGGTPEAPVGTVFVGIAGPGQTRIIRLGFDIRDVDARSQIRHLTALNVMAAVLRLLKKGDKA